MPIPTNPDWTQIVQKLLENNTQVELCKKTGVHQGTISEIYRGEPKPRLSFEYGAALLNAYNELEQTNLA